MITQQLGENPETTQEATLLLIKRAGELTVSDLCKELGITSMAVRRHLASLQTEGLIESRLVRQSRGRPTYRYKLTDKAESLFPTGFQNLAIDILDLIYEQSGHKGVMDLLNRRNDRLAQRFPARMAGKGIEERVAEVAKIFTEMAIWPSGNHCLTEISLFFSAIAPSTTWLLNIGSSAFWSHA